MSNNQPEQLSQPALWHAMGHRDAGHRDVGTSRGFLDLGGPGEGRGQ